MNTWEYLSASPFSRTYLAIVAKYMGSDPRRERRPLRDGTLFAHEMMHE